MTALLEIQNLHANVAGNEILRGVDLTVNPGEVHAIMGPNGSGKSTLAHVLAGRPGYTVTQGRVLYKGKDLLAMAPRSARARASSSRSSTRSRSPASRNVYFLKAAVNAVRKHRGLPEYDAMEFLALVKQKAKLVEIDEDLVKRPVNEGFSGGEKKRNEIFQMALLDPSLAILDETDSGLDIDALRIVAGGVNQLRSAERSMIVVTHYQRLLELHRPRLPPRARRGPHRPLRRQGARPRARGEGLRVAREGAAGRRRGPLMEAVAVDTSFAPEPLELGGDRGVARGAAPRGLRALRGARLPDAEERGLALHGRPADHRDELGPRARASPSSRRLPPAGVRVRRLSEALRDAEPLLGQDRATSRRAPSPP